jgi:hypothetical protein
MLEGFGGPVRMDKEYKGSIDPTLDSCCQREIESNRKISALQSTLRRHDRIALAERRRRNVIPNLSFGEGCRCCYDPESDGGEYGALMELREANLTEKIITNADETNDYIPSTQKEDDKESNYSDDDSEFDFLLDETIPGQNELEQERLQELQLCAMIRDSARQHGFGAHRQFHPARLLHAAGLGMGGIRGNRAAAIPPAVVVHLYDPDSVLCASLDLYLEEIAEHIYKGTKFMRSNGRSTLAMNANLVKESLPKLNSDTGIPALIAVKDGVVVSFCPISSLGSEREGRIEEHAVEQWLDNAGVLLRDVPLEFEDYCRVRPEEDALIENMMREKARLDEMKHEEIYNCGVPGCQKTFYHEHVGVANEVQSGLLVDKDTVTSL